MHCSLTVCFELTCSRATNEEAQLRNVAGSNIFSEDDPLQIREVNQRKLQVEQGFLPHCFLHLSQINTSVSGNMRSIEWPLPRCPLQQHY